MPIPALRAAQTTNTTGTGTLVLNASPVGRRSFLAAFGAGSSRIRYVIQGTTFFEVGLGDYDGGTPGNLTRVTVLTSSNSDALVSLPVGVADVFTFIDPAARVVVTGTGAITAALVDIGNLVHWSGTAAAAFNFPVITTVPPGQGYLVTNGGTAVLTLDPAGAELINGAATIALLPGESADCYRSGAAWVAALSVRPPRVLVVGTGLADAAATLTGAQLYGGLFTITPTVARILTLDTVVNILAAVLGHVDNSNFEFTVVNNAAFDVTIALPAGITAIGRLVINNGSATWRLRRTSATTLELWRVGGAALTGRFLRVTRYSTAGTAGSPWSRPADTVSVRIRTIAGGAGGTNAPDINVSGRGGGAGGTADIYIAAAAASYAFVVGAGGAAGANGGETTIAGIAAGGGLATGVGGLPTGGSVNIRGGGSMAAAANAGGVGGSSSYGGGGASTVSAGGVGVFGGGGAGGASDGATAHGGGAGGAGYIEISEYS